MKNKLSCNLFVLQNTLFTAVQSKKQYVLTSQDTAYLVKEDAR